MLRRLIPSGLSLHTRVVQTLATPLPPIPPPSPPSTPAHPSPSPSTAHSLPLSGGDARTSRHALRAHLVHLMRSLDLPAQARFHPNDVEPFAPSARTAFVGVGAETNWPALHAAMEGGVFIEGGVDKVVVIRDVFDRSEERKTLTDWFALVADDVAAVNKQVVRGQDTSRRFVNEYIREPDGRFMLGRNDMDLVEYLHSSGVRVLPVGGKHELDALRDGRAQVPVQQSTNHVLACAPTAFQFNRSAAMDNHFMDAEELEKGGDGDITLRRQVLDEFSGLHQVLTDKVNGVGAKVHLFTHEEWHNTPDACFPNNTFSTHTNIETGSSCVLVLYPMKDETRRKERRLVKRLLTSGRYTQVYDLTREEIAPQPKFLEGTGSLVLDRVNRIAYVALSQRSDLALARQWARVMGYDLEAFTATDRAGRAIYHTNVMMSVGTRVAVVCGESIEDLHEREGVFGKLRDTGHDVVDISMAQVEKFCGNVLELETYYGEQVMVMSSAAHEGFGEDQREQLLGGVEKLVHADISTIERVGGGGVRCTIAELH